MKVFLDTNVWVSAFAGCSLCGDLIAESLEIHEVLCSDLVLQEACSVIDRKLQLTDSERNLAMALMAFATRVEEVAQPDNDNDARLVASAAAANAELFVTGDKRILDWKSSGTLRIVTPRDAWIILIPANSHH